MVTKTLSIPTGHSTLVYNFAKFWPDFQNPFTGGLNSKRVMKRSHHHTSNASHYLVKRKCQKTRYNLQKSLRLKQFERSSVNPILVFHSIYQFRDVARPNLTVDNREFFTPHLYLRPNAPHPQSDFSPPSVGYEKKSNRVMSIKFGRLFIYRSAK